MRNKKFFVVLLALLALSLVALQCGAAEPTATPVPPTPTEEEMMEEATATTAPEEEMMEMEPVKVGVMTPLTGALSEFGPNFRNAAELAQKHLAAAGYEIEIVIGDTETSAIPAVETARQLVEVEGVHALAGAASSGVTIPIAESVTIPNQVPQISNASTSPLITNLPADEGQDFLFRTAPSDALQGVVLADLARALGYESVSVLYVNNPYGQGLNDVFRENFEAAGGTVPASVPHDEDPAPTYNAELQQATEGDPQALIALGYTGHATVYLREALEGEFFSNFLFVDGTQSQEIPEAVGAAPLEGQCGTAPGSVESSSLEAFNQAYAADYGEPPPLPFITNMYDAVIAAGLAAYEAQVQGEELSSVAVRDHLRSVAAPEGETVGAGAEGMTQALQLIDQGQAINYEGSAGSVDFDENGDVQTPIQIWCYEGGEIVAQQLVAPGEEITGLEMAQPTPMAATPVAEVPDLGGRELTIGSDTTYPPFEMVDENQNIIGFDPALMERICELANCTATFQTTAWDGIFAALAAGEFDAVMSAVTITEERDEIVDFTVPYYQVGQVVTVRADEDRIQSYQDLAQEGIITGVQTGTTGEFAAIDEAQVPEDQIQRYETIDLAFLALVNGDIDAVVADSPTSQNYVGQHEGSIKIVGGEGRQAWFTTEDYGIAIQEGSPELQEAFNAAIRILREDGTVDGLLTEWEVE